ncbi:MAG: MFS transporter [Phycisphaerales bacterium]
MGLPAPPDSTDRLGRQRRFWDMTGYQWLVIFAAWLGWGFDVFDALLFNTVADRCLPDLLHVAADSSEGKAAVGRWTGALSSLLLIGWAIGGIGFGRITDRVGRTRTLLITMLIYSLATAACAFAPNIWVFTLCRFVASLGIGGEWAAGASLVAEVVPAKRRVHAGALLYSSSPLGVLLAIVVAGFVSKQVAHLSDDPSHAWRAVFLTGLIPAGFAFLIRLKVKEPEAWTSEKSAAARATIRELFSPAMRRATLGGVSLAVIALISWWSVNAFIPVLSARLVPEAPGAAKFTSGLWFNLGGILGTALTVPVAMLGRRVLFYIYFLFTSGAILLAFRLDVEPSLRFALFGLTGIGTYGLCAAFAFYLPELFPTRLRGTGSGFCYNAGRIIAATGPFAVGAVSRSGTPGELAHAISWSAVFPLLGIVVLMAGLGNETCRRASTGPDAAAQGNSA